MVSVTYLFELDEDSPINKFWIKPIHKAVEKLFPSEEDKNQIVDRLVKNEAGPGHEKNVEAVKSILRKHADAEDLRNLGRVGYKSLPSYTTGEYQNKPLVRFKLKLPFIKRDINLYSKIGKPEINIAPGISDNEKAILGKAIKGKVGNKEIESAPINIKSTRGPERVKLTTAHELSHHLDQSAGYKDDIPYPKPINYPDTPEGEKRFMKDYYSHPKEFVARGGAAHVEYLENPHYVASGSPSLKEQIAHLRRATKRLTPEQREKAHSGY